MNASSLIMISACALLLVVAPTIAASEPVGEPFIGEVRLFAGGFPPRGWVDCNGQLMDIQDNSALFSILGTIYGGDGRNSFALPDLRGAVAIHNPSRLGSTAVIDPADSDSDGIGAVGLRYIIAVQGTYPSFS